MIRRAPSIPLIALMCAATVALSTDTDGVYTDPQGDAVIRRTDAGNNAPLPPGFEPIDLLEVRVEGWETPTPETNPYTGSATGGDANLVRIRVTVDGLVVPPGPIALDGSSYQPYMFGDRPIFGYIELDIDDQKNSGGEFMPLAKNRYLANVGRFGKSPSSSIADRMVRVSKDDIDSNFSSAPQFERTGSEFTLALCGCFTPTIVTQNGDMDSIFDAGETWIVSGRFFERFNAFQPESGLFGGSDFGLFDPVVELQFKHDQVSNTTSITLVFPVTNEGSAELLGAPVVQAINSNVSQVAGEQTSIAEALDDLIYGAEYATGDLYHLTEPWEGRQLDDYFRPRDWGVSALIGTASTVKDPAALFVWTDTGFSETEGDLNSDDLSNTLDSQIILDTIDTLDGTECDADEIINGQVAIVDFGCEFDLRDLNGDGIIADDDIIVSVCIADFTNDGVLNFFDVSAFLTAYNAMHPSADLNNDAVLNFFDVSAFLSAFSAGCP